MIPEFPNFKKLELSDKEEIEKFVSNFPPYSAFNFINLLIWDIKNTRKISKLNDNLVIFFTDYETDEPFLSFLGNNKCKDTILKLVSFAQKEKISTKLRFITEEIISQIKSDNLNIEEDRDNFDYLFSPFELSNYTGIKFKKHRHLAKRFLQDYPNAIFKIENLNNEKNKNDIHSVLRKWENGKKLENKFCNLSYEEKAIDNLLKNISDKKLILSYVLIDNKMIGFSIDEILPNEVVISHFVKADNSFRGIYEFLNKKLASYLFTLGIKTWNWQQDLNIKNLRETKLGYRPVSFLKRFSVSYKI